MSKATRIFVDLKVQPNEFWVLSSIGYDPARNADQPVSPVDRRSFLFGPLFCSLSGSLAESTPEIALSFGKKTVKIF